MRTPRRTSSPRMFCVVLIAALLAPCAALGDATGACPTMRGPFIVTPKHKVVYKQAGMQAGAPVHVTVGPLQVGDAVARMVPIDKQFHVGADGRMVLRFRWPAHARVCVGAAECHPVAWANAQRAYVRADVGADVARPSGCGYKHVTIRIGSRH